MLGGPTAGAEVITTGRTDPETAVADVPIAIVAAANAVAAEPVAALLAIDADEIVPGLAPGDPLLEELGDGGSGLDLDLVREPASVVVVDEQDLHEGELSVEEKVTWLLQNGECLRSTRELPRFVGFVTVEHLRWGQFVVVEGVRLRRKDAEARATNRGQVVSSGLNDGVVELSLGHGINGPFLKWSRNGNLQKRTQPPGTPERLLRRRDRTRYRAVIHVWSARSGLELFR